MGYVFFVLMLGLTVLLIPFSRAAALGAADGLSLFYRFVLPSLFPFFVCSHYLTSSEAFRRISLSRWFIPLFAAPITALCGTPSSALIFGRLYSTGTLSIKRASVLCAALNQTGPSFIISALCIGMLGNVRSAYAFIISHYAPAFIAAILLSLGSVKNSRFVRTPEPSESPLTSFSAAVSGAVVNILRVGGTIVFFKSIYSVLSSAFPFSEGIPGAVLTGLFEMTNGISLLVGYPGKLALSLSAFLMTFGGACIFIQSKMIFNELSALYFFAAKLILGAVSFSVFYLICPSLDDSRAVFGELGEALASVPSGAGARLAVFICTAISVLFTIMTAMLFSKLSVIKKQTTRQSDRL